MPAPAALRERLARWLFLVGSAPSHDVVLVQRRVFILPTRLGLAFGVTLALMLTASVNYNLSLGYVLTFLLGAMGLNAMLHTYRNLANLRVAATHSTPVYAGERARFTVELGNDSAYGRYSIAFTRDGNEIALVDVPARQTTLATIAMDAPRRGILRPGRLTLYTRYPLGLYRAWSYLELDLSCLVYPRPAAAGIPLPAQTAAHRDGAAAGAGEDDFAGLRPYHAGDSPRRVAWKASARGEALLAKQFSGRATAECWLDWHDTPPGLDLEARLAWLTRWVLDAHAANIGYGLKLPGVAVPISVGELHRARCLETLALFRVPHD
ncbi:MAG TPA: DUF58 domain-containing protein [Burkholderiales bacterium]|nr:DUF58 domain-containing protein [Burkholderiales bacterium]